MSSLAIAICIASLPYLVCARETARWIYGKERARHIDNWVQRHGVVVTEKLVREGLQQFVANYYRETMVMAVIIGALCPVFWMVSGLYIAFNYTLRKAIVDTVRVVSKSELVLIQECKAAKAVVADKEQ